MVLSNTQFYTKFAVLLLLISTLVTNTCSVFAHTGPIATAFPVSNITIDGDLSDWPDHLPAYQLEQSNSITAENKTEISGQFQVGYDRANHKIYVAIKTQDDDIITTPLPNLPIWNSQDSAEVCINLSHSITQTQPAQFHYRDQYNAYPDVHTNHGNAIQKAKDNTINYEFEIDLTQLNESKTPLPNGTIIGFDVLVVDCDSDEKIHSLQWGPILSDKWRNSQQLADLIISDQEPKFGTVTGTLNVASVDDEEDKIFPPVYIQSVKNPDVRIQTSCNDDGSFSLQAPIGKYSIHVADTTNLRVLDIKSKQIEINENKETALSEFKVKQIPEPEFTEEKGILQQHPKFDTERIDAFITANMEYHMIPGVSLAVIHDSKIAYFKTYGVTHNEIKEPVVENTVFEAASMTKCVFAFAVNRLVERNIIDIDQPLHTYLPDNPYTKDVWGDPHYKTITAKHVLTHRTGFPNWRDGKLAIQFEPGTDYGYSGEGFEFLGTVISHLTGDGLEEVIFDEVFQPLGIENAYLTWNAILTEQKATAHTGGNVPMDKEKNSKPGMAWSLVIDAQNYAKFLIAILDRIGLNHDTYHEMLTQQYELNIPKNEYENPFGLGFVVEDTPVGKKFSHGGTNTGFQCLFGIFDDLDMGYVIMTNSDRGHQLTKKLDTFLITGSEKK